MPLRIYDSGNLELSRISGTYMGDAGTGKTHYMCSWPDVLLLSFDPDTQTAQKTPGVKIVEVPSWEAFETEVLPQVNNRTVSDWVGKEIQTVCVDTLSVASMRLANEIQGGRERLTIQDFGTFLNKLTATVMQMVDATRMYEEGQPTYNILFSTHLAPETNEQGHVLSIRPAIMGQFKHLLPRLAGFAFLCAVEKRVTPATDAKGKPVPGKMNTEVVRGVHTVPPNERYVVVDRIGGGGGKYNELPPFVGGSYQDLMDAWGFKQ